MRNNLIIAVSLILKLLFTVISSMSSTIKKRQLNEHKNDLKTKPSKKSTKGQKKTLTSRYFLILCIMIIFGC